MQGVYKAIRDGQATIESYFPKKETIDEPLGIPDEIAKEAEERFK